MEESTLELVRVNEELRREVAERKATERHIARLSRIHQALSDAGEAIVRIDDETRLFKDICNITLRLGELALVWVGMHDPVRDVLVPEAAAGELAESLKEVFFPLDSASPAGHALACEAFRREVPMVRNDYPADEERAYWYKQLPPGSVVSVACFPLRRRGRTVGVLSIGSAEAGYFDEEVVRMFEAMALNITYGLDNLAQSTELRETLSALRASEERYRSLLETSFDWIWEVDAEARYTYASPRVFDILGYLPEEVLGRTPFDFMPEQEALLVGAVFGEIAAARRPFSLLENVNLHRDGRQVILETNGVPVFGPDGEFKGYRGMDRDITARKRAEEQRMKAEAQLRQVQKMEALGTLAGGIAHDFNNILGIILGYTEMVEWDVGEESPARKNLQEVLKAAHRARDLVQQILAFSRRSEQEKRPVRIDLIVKEALKLLRASLPSTIEIKLDITTGSAVMADPTQMHQVLMNLCANASHAMRDRGGLLEVALTDVRIFPGMIRPPSDLQPGPYVKLTVRDTGHGISPSVLERIFDPFFTTKDLGEGTGLGLAVVHGIVKSHGGAIAVESSPDEGAVFHVFIPALEIGEEPHEVEMEVLPRGCERILLVDDEPALAKAAKRMLERLGYEVDYRPDGLEALEAFRRRMAKNPYDVVITDMTMPQLTGAELARELLDLDPKLPVILCTGFSENMDVETARELGISAFLIKPVVMRQLAEAIREVLAGKKD